MYNVYNAGKLRDNTVLSHEKGLIGGTASLGERGIGVTSLKAGGLCIQEMWDFSGQGCTLGAQK